MNKGKSCGTTRNHPNLKRYTKGGENEYYDEMTSQNEWGKNDDINELSYLENYENNEIKQASQSFSDRGDSKVLRDFI